MNIHVTFHNFAEKSLHQTKVVQETSKYFKRNFCSTIDLQLLHANTEIYLVTDEKKNAF